MDKMSLLEKSKMIDVRYLFSDLLYEQRAKELGDKKRLLKEALKERTENERGNNQQQSLINSKFAQPLENGVVYCICCKVKLSDNLAAVKHFAQSAEHKEVTNARVHNTNIYRLLID